MNSCVYSFQENCLFRLEKNKKLSRLFLNSKFSQFLKAIKGAGSP